MQLFNRSRAIWTANEQYSYGWFVPVLAAGLLWRSWSERPRNKAGRKARNAIQRKDRTPAWLKVSGFILGPSFLSLAGPALGLLLPFRILEEANPG